MADRPLLNRAPAGLGTTIFAETSELAARTGSTNGGARHQPIVSLPERCGVMAIPDQIFYADPQAGRPLVRYAFRKRADALQEAVTRLKRTVLRTRPALRHPLSGGRAQSARTRGEP
ncbi:hypothetical protein [Streptomyces atratus]|uniref:hypothetical protein n=1 Tax=Streptomyces atratus TaxID=1893 RepID=UPI0037AED156